MSHYKANVRDLEFNLFEVLDLEKALATGEFGDLDGEAIREMLAEAARLAQGPLAESFADGDRNPPEFDPDSHAVRLPESFKASVRAWQDAGWPQLGLDEGLGDVHVPAAVNAAVNEFLFGAQPAAFFYMTGPAMLSVMYRAGTPQQRRWAEIGIARNWGATMVLTEPDAGSDVGSARTRAIDQHDGTWHIDGIKRFITSGDSDDLFENIAHLVLARPEGAPPGSKGLSLFLVPKYLFDPQTGEPGDRNGVFATALEHKMGLTASATCELAFGQHGVPAVGWLVGDTHRGIAQMFGIMLYARLMVGIKSIATLSSGYLNALEFAKTRVQGPDLTRMSDKTAPRVRIISHPDVRRSLLTQKAYAEGLRALYLYAATHQDPVCAQLVSDTSPQMASRINDLMLPIVKGAGSERAYACLAESLQVLGGSGYLRDYPIEQYVRDAKIDSLYEGTTAIQAQDFVFRQVVRDGGETLGHLLAQVEQFCDGGTSHNDLTAARARLAQALGDVRGMLSVLLGYASASNDEPTEVYRVGLRAVPFLLSIADLLIGWLLLWHAEVALDAIAVGATQRDSAFYRGKVAAAVFFAETVLPRLAADRVVIESQGLSEMNVDEEAF
ncbi:acyl-CoA dehydrogenase [Mycolicibacterium moriokaense]|uniref:Broad-specificity linear acyl-CoA dehydrogenase FadE5 n=1 Tax=Mycolicibacterium moriokaense TaxID=39691 RepID=A0A318HET2_9MYCO|nr:acyl-CoA dehydrogenase [Mycolicibacterium moriokaense]PXX07667.1 alkylation response protein AidB-like acyl-CoA dehydrogenase [Mycolicibacterium moriokaense]